VCLDSDVESHFTLVLMRRVHAGCGSRSGCLYTRRLCVLARLLIESCMRPIGSENSFDRRRRQFICKSAAGRCKPSRPTQLGGCSGAKLLSCRAAVANCRDFKQILAVYLHAYPHDVKMAIMRLVFALSDAVWRQTITRRDTKHVDTTGRTLC